MAPARTEIHRILCPVDFSDFSALAVERAVHLARWFEARVEVLHVLPFVIPTGLPDFPVPLEVTEAQREQATKAIEGERHQEKEEKNKKFHRVERSYGKFVRRFTMPEDADETSVLADFKEGVLNVHVAKSTNVKPKAVEVKVA